MRFKINGNNIVLLVILALFLFLPIAGMAAGPERVSINTAKADNLNITSGKSVILESDIPIKRFSIASPGIADLIVLTPRQVYITGKALGTTNLSFWGDGNKLFATFDLEVTPDVSSLKNKLHKIFPDEKDIRVSTAGDSVVLAGTVSNAVNLSHVLAIAESYASGGKDKKQRLINLLEVGGVHQVMLEVRISEMSKSLGRKIGVNFNAIDTSGKSGSVSFMSNLANTNTAYNWTRGTDGSISILPKAIDATLSGILSISKVTGDLTWMALIDAMKERGLIKVLAEPTLITLSGKKANFLAGGEYPIPEVDKNGNLTTTFKTFGVALNFTPTVLGNGRISMDVTPEVSDLDFTNAVYLNGYFVPGLNTRRVSTTVELADGQSFVIAGLLREDVKEAVKKIPLLGEIPVLGVLFSSSQFQKNETELVIIVTPHLVKPVDLAKQTLPTDQFVEPNDLEFYLLGFSEGIGSSQTSTETVSQPSISGGGGLDGDFGHIIP